MHHPPPQPAAHRLRAQHGPRVQRLVQYFTSGYLPPPPEDKPWRPKNPDIRWPHMHYETNLSEQEWRESGFPFSPLPAGIEGVVNLEAWEAKIADLSGKEDPNTGMIKLLEDVKAQLSNGASSGVQYPGNTHTYSANWLQDPPKQVPRVVDALACMTKNGHMAGPIFDKDLSEVKVNSIMAVD